jgi:cytoskeletal protein CcmA (bactofilin family)
MAAVFHFPGRFAGSVAAPVQREDGPSFPKMGGREKELPIPTTFACFSPVMANPTNVLSSGIEITGSIRFSNDMIIDGKIDGEITSDKGRVTIGENAIIKGDVTAGEVKVYGKVEGKITSQRCELKDKSKINGDIKSKVFSMEEGAQLSGRTDIGG